MYNIHSSQGALSTGWIWVGDSSEKILWWLLTAPRPKLTLNSWAWHTRTFISGHCFLLQPCLLPHPALCFPQLCWAVELCWAPTHLKSTHHLILKASPVLPQPRHAPTIALTSCTVTVYMRSWYGVAVKEQGLESPAVWVLVPNPTLGLQSLWASICFLEKWR